MGRAPALPLVPPARPPGGRGRRRDGGHHRGHAGGAGGRAGGVPVGVPGRVVAVLGGRVRHGWPAVRRLRDLSWLVGAAVPAVVVGLPRGGRRAVDDERRPRGAALRLSVGHVSVGHVSVGHLSVGHVSVGHLSVGHVSVGTGE
ncbi:hypothetical protein [Blastococcus sp. SYSU DS0973]